MRNTAIASIVFTVLAMSPSWAGAVRLKELATVHGARPNHLIGYGIVVGLNGTGDDRQVLFTVQSVSAMLSRMGLRVEPSRLVLKNVAAVSVTAELPAFVKSGTRIDVRVASIGNAKSIKGGVLLATPLKGVDGKVYALAQGPIQVDARPGDRKAVLTSGMVVGGALVEREVPVCLGENGEISLALRRPDFTTAARVAHAINESLGQKLATPTTPGEVEVVVPRDMRDGRVVEFISMLEGVEIVPDLPARVVINPKTGTVVVGPGVTIATAAVSHAGVLVKIQGSPKMRYLGGATLSDVVDALNALGVGPQDLAAIFRALKSAGVLNAELVIR